MTRDEAIKILDARANTGSPNANAIDSLIALGILKVDAPRSGLDKLKSRLVGDFGYSHCSSCIKDVEAALAAAGLRIVER